jgi:hypothetical protein
VTGTHLLLGKSIQAATKLTAVLAEEHLELGPGWLIDDVLGGRRWEGRHERSISGPAPASQLAIFGKTLA